ncbi:glucan endo-1 3-beta-glucosidase-like [Tripterygium wilfordii]|uniref:glucan endo-1,3-beta-D-glucosidase n=1 Tax=Tripterygium wilfordii TaxID=458696 RepID=A0A7J7D406_TRIWF|nr:glucan endo-1 3-beta-glucosidase-like [Tripterygium wilfordii]
MQSRTHHHFLYSLCYLLLSLLYPSTDGAPVGICYGRVANNLPPPSTVVSILKSNAISNVRIFDIDCNTLQSFAGTGISLTIGIPNDILPALASGTPTTSIEWLQSHIFFHIPANQIRYIAVGNEIFLKDPVYILHLLPAIKNLYQALLILNLANTIKLSSPQAASVIVSSYPPSSATFDPSIKPTLIPLLQFLRESRSNFMINLYPYISYLKESAFIAADYALFGSRTAVQDGALMYNNLFDASVDAFVYALEKEGFPEIPVVVTETGWPTAGGAAASVGNALAYNENVVRRAAGNFGTPKRPAVGVEVYLFDIFDENGKVGEEYEKHFGIFGLDGLKIYDLNFK